jgi:hypothetical protein
MAQWEYRFEVLDLQGSDESLDESKDELNRLGHLGWEVVSLVPKMGAGESWCVALLKRETNTAVAAHG